MINLDPIQFLKQKLDAIILAFVLSGCIMIGLGIAIIFFPTIIQYLFVLGFVAVGIALILIGSRLKNIADILSRFEILKEKIITGKKK